MDERELRVGDLARSRRSSELENGLDQMDDASRASGVALREESPVWIDRQTAAELDMPGFNEGAPFAPLAEAEVLKLDDDGNREVVIKQSQIHVMRRHAGRGEDGRVRLGV